MKRICHKGAIGWVLGGVGLAFICVSSALMVVDRLARQNLHSLLARQVASHKAAQKILERDVDDLMAQLEHGLQRTDLSSGTLEFSLGARGLRAVHSKVPASPIDIDTNDARGAFVGSLDFDSELSFWVFADNGALLGSGGVKRPSVYAYKVADLIRTSGAVAQGQYLGPRAEILPEGEPSMRDLLRGRVGMHLRFARLPRSNLLIVTGADAEDALASAFHALRPLGLALMLLALAFTGLIAYAAYGRKNIRDWFGFTLSEFKFGRFNAVNPPRAMLPTDRALANELFRQFSSQSPFSPVHSGQWLNPGLRVGTWPHFKQTLALWGQHKKVGFEVVVGEAWFAARIRVSQPRVLESAVRIFGRAFSTRGAVFNHYSDHELLVVARATHFEEAFEKLGEASRALTAFENLRVGEFGCQSVFVAAEQKADEEAVLASLGLGEATWVPPGSWEKNLRALTDLHLSVYELGARKKPVVGLSWIQLTEIPLAKVRSLYVFDLALAEMERAPSAVRLPPWPSADQFSAAGHAVHNIGAARHAVNIDAARDSGPNARPSARRAVRGAIATRRPPPVNFRPSELNKP